MEMLQARRMFAAEQLLSTTDIRIQEIADLCGIDKDLTFHMARHTFATTVTLANGVPIETLSKMLGHTNIQTTQIYARVIDTQINNAMEALALKLNARSIIRQTETTAV